MKNILASLIFAWAVLIGVEGCAMSDGNHKFRFEDYKKAEDAKEALLKLHPVGSSVDDLVRTLEGAGAKVNEVPEKNKKYVKIDQETKGLKHYSYFEKKLILGYKWGGGIIYDISEGTIVDFGVNRYGEAL